MTLGDAKLYIHNLVLENVVTEGEAQQMRAVAVMKLAPKCGCGKRLFSEYERCQGKCFPCQAKVALGC